MDAFLTGQILDSLSKGETSKFLTYLIVFFFIWIEVRGMKKELKSLNLTVTNSFHDGEKRFDKIEAKQEVLEKRITTLESFDLTGQMPKTQVQGGTA